jgi:hypothetical protein
MTGRTESDVGARFLGMTCGKARAVEAWHAYVVEGETSRENRYGSHAVA